jgi:4-carboxymuconolactone decarboxylase
MEAMTENEGGRDKRGWERFREVNGEASEKIMQSLEAISPDLARYVLEFAYGKVYDRPGLDMRTREIVALSALVTMGSATPQLKSHIHGALNVGVTREEIMEIMIQMAAYAGFPAALNGITAARDVFEACDRMGES